MFHPAERLGELASGNGRFEQDPFLTPDELTIVFVTDRDVGGKGYIYRATRAAADVPFEPPAKVVSLSDPSADQGKVTFARDFTIAIMASNVASPDGSLWYGTHEAGTDLDVEWEWDMAPIGAGNKPNETEVDPWISDDGLRLYWTRDFADATSTPTRIDVATRDSIADSFGAPVALVSHASENDFDPNLAFEERLMVFGSTRGTNKTDTNLWFATRTSSTPTDPFDPPEPLESINTTAGETDPWLSRDGCRVYFSSNANGNDDLFVARMMLP